MSTNKFLSVINFTSLICFSLSLLLSLICPIHYKLSSININDKTYITYEITPKNLRHDDIIIITNNNETFTTKLDYTDLGNYRVYTENDYYTFSKYHGKIIATLPFISPLQPVEYILIVLIFISLYKHMAYRKSKKKQVPSIDIIL